MTKEDKALLDMIAYSEGTLGVSNNGYDVVVGSKRVINGWTKDTTIIHGGQNWYDKQTNSTAAGRYQFLYPTWIGNKKNNLPMTKENQDKRGIELINGRIGNLDKTTIINRQVFNKCLNKLALEWASIPLTSNITDSEGKIHYAGNSYYGQPKQSADKLYEIYKLALSKY